MLRSLGVSWAGACPARATDDAIPAAMIATATVNILIRWFISVRNDG